MYHFEEQIKTVSVEFYRQLFLRESEYSPPATKYISEKFAKAYTKTNDPQPEVKFPIHLDDDHIITKYANDVMNWLSKIIIK